MSFRTYQNSLCIEELVYGESCEKAICQWGMSDLCPWPKRFCSLMDSRRETKGGNPGRTEWNVGASPFFSYYSCEFKNSSKGLGYLYFTNVNIFIHSPCNCSHALFQEVLESETFNNSVHSKYI